MSNQLQRLQQLHRRQQRPQRQQHASYASAQASAQAEADQQKVRLLKGARSYLNMTNQHVVKLLGLLYRQDSFAEALHLVPALQRLLQSPHLFICLMQRLALSGLRCWHS